MKTRLLTISFRVVIVISLRLHYQRIKEKSGKNAALPFPQDQKGKGSI
jgi:hypothetical protein